MCCYHYISDKTTNHSSRKQYTNTEPKITISSVASHEPFQQWLF